jgi:hypothetical protein
MKQLSYWLVPLASWLAGKFVPGAVPGGSGGVSASSMVPPLHRLGISRPFYGAIVLVMDCLALPQIKVNVT